MKNRVALTGTSRLKSKAPRFLVLWIVGSLAAVSVLLGCATGANPGAEETPAAVSTARGAGEESPGERGPGGESGSESGGVAGGTGSEEASGANLAPDETFEAVRGGARLVLNYDGASNAFTGTVKNTTAGILGNVRIEVHLSNGTELGPTTPVELAPGQVMDINLPSTTAAFTGWIAHAEVGSGAEGSQAGGEASGGESGPDCPECPESGAAGNEAAREAAMSSPIIPLDQSWEGVLGGLAISANFDAATGSAHATVTNSTEQKLCYVQAEPHLKSGTQTVGELGPDMLGDLSPGQQAISGVSVDTEPGLAGVAFDGYVVHMEVFDCGGPGPQPHSGGEGAGGSGGEGPGGEGHGPGGEVGSESVIESGNESGAWAGEEGSSANQLALDETFDEVRGGARLILGYNPASNAFTGTVENITGGILSNVRIEVHLSNGTELGPTTPTDLTPGQVLAVSLPATLALFDGWIAHAEVGGGESGGEHGPGGSGGHGSGGESGGEHGGPGDGRSGG